VATTQDCSIGIGVETTYKTPVTVTRWFEYADESIDWNKSIKQGKGLRVGSRVARSGRRVITSAQGGGDFSLEVVSKGLGLLWQACLGSSVSNLVSGSTFQQVHTLGDNPSSLTVQKGLARIDPTSGVVSVDPYTYAGCMVDSWELDFGNDDIPMLKTSINAGDLATATAYTTPSYASTPTVFSFKDATIASGTLTAPTTTALASGTTTIADVRGGSISVNNNLATRFNIGAAGRQVRPTQGLRTISGKIDVEYDSIAFRDAVINETPMCLILNYTGAALSTGVEQLQIVAPRDQVRLRAAEDERDRPDRSVDVVPGARQPRRGPADLGRVPHLRRRPLRWSRSAPSAPTNTSLRPASSTTTPTGR
jgi:hypothetical protein